MVDSCLTVLANLLINTHFANSRCMFVITDNNDGFDYIGDVPKVQIKFVDKLDPGLIFKNYGCQEIIVKSSNSSLIFGDFEKLIRLNLERFNERRYLIVADTPRGALDILARDEINYVSNVLIVAPSGEPREGVFDLITHRYVGDNVRNDPVWLDKWFCSNNTLFSGNDLYPDKISNQHGRAVKMATFTYEPYSIIGNSSGEYYGSELSTVMHYAQKLNMTPVPVIITEGYWGEIFANWSGNGVMGCLAQDQADIGFAALYTWEFAYHYLDLSKPLVRTGITCLVPAPKLAAGWLTPLFSYSVPLWIIIGVTFFISILILTFILYFYNRNSLTRMRYQEWKEISFLNLLESSAMKISKPLLAQSITAAEMPKYFSGKFLMLLILIFSIFFSSTYSSGLASVMTVPRYEGAIDTLYDFVASGINWGGTQDGWIMSIQNAKEPAYVSIVSKFVPTSEKNLREYSLRSDFGFSIERLPYENYAIGSYIKGDVIHKYHVMQQDFYWEQSVIMTRKNSILLPSLDAFILRAFQAGLISVWQNKAVVLYMDTTVQKAVKYYVHHQQDKVVVKLKWIHVEGAFGVLLVGYSISSLVFIGELIAKKYQK